MANNSVLARVIVRNVGTIDNVNTLEHCTTRLRFTVRDHKAVDKEALRATPGVLSVIGGNLVANQRRWSQISGLWSR
ncbi:PTS transporter subunit EIIB [Microbacterium testaceum]|uniref:PTS transporter subunit EIIB n=1 Tax=Microbacterium testaceum TaxID=2033 RepID=UPI0012ACE7C2|nr:PTS transporter subunit EIIB [Microbacterium testaceum]